MLSRIWRSTAHLIADPHSEGIGALAPLSRVVGKTSGIVPGLLSTVTDEYPRPEQVRWSEAVRVSVEMRNGAVWLLVDPDVWIWPARCRQNATEFLAQRRRDRFNRKYNDLLTAWVQIILSTDRRGIDVELSVPYGPKGVGESSFVVGSRTAFAWRLGL